MKPVTWCHSISSALMISQLTSDLNLASNYLGYIMAWSMKNSLALKKRQCIDLISLVAVQLRSRETSECHLVMKVPYLFKIVNSINYGSLCFCAFLFFFLSPFLCSYSSGVSFSLDICIKRPWCIAFSCLS